VKKLPLETVLKVLSCLSKINGLRNQENIAGQKRKKRRIASTF
jgi:hypothetical protein